ncbi:hypothetical protein BH20CHL6_BH20CHL6_00650 [soil metagenome]
MLELGALLVIVLAGVVFAQGSGSVAVFLGIVAFLGVWGGQAVHAHRSAVARGARPGGAIQILALAPVAIVVVTGFWLEAGSAASPAATLERYVSAWREGRTAVAEGLFVEPTSGSALVRVWAEDDTYLRDRVSALADQIDADGGPDAEGGLDAERPFESLQFVAVQEAIDDRSASFEMTIVRRVTVDSTFLGIFPAAALETQPMEVVGRIELRLVPRGPGPLEALDEVWRLQSVSVPPAS